jgi:hypothetical protein
MPARVTVCVSFARVSFARVSFARVSFARVSFVCISILCSTVVAAQEKVVPVDFVRDIQPLLTRHCIKCHGANKHESGLRLDARVDAMRGGDTGLVIVPGSSDKSLLVQRISSADPDERMPPKDSLNGEQVALVRRWIDQGATWPESVPTLSTGVSHWSFRQISRPELPSAKDNTWAHNAIDQFVLARLERFGIEPVAANSVNAFVMECS